MASFDFVESSSKSYQFVWTYRKDVVRLSAMVLSLKVLSFIGFIAFGLSQDILRQGLLLTPVYLLEGWVIARLIVMALYNEQAEQRKNILPQPQDIEANMKASMIIYALTKLALSFVIGSALQKQVDMGGQAAPEPSLHMFFLATGFLVFSIWSFRFLWLYVPVIMGKNLGAYIAKFKSFFSSFYLLGVWFLCFVPLILLLLVFSEILGNLFTVMGFEGEDIIFRSGLGALQAIIDYLLALVSSLGVAYGMFSVFNDENKKTEIW